MQFSSKTKQPFVYFFSIVLCVISASVTMQAQAKPEVLMHNEVNMQQGKATIQAENVDTSSRLWQLEKANSELLVKNASLEQDKNSLETKVNVLTAERSNQIFMTGAFVAIGGIFLGFIGAWLLIGRKQSEW